MASVDDYSMEDVSLRVDLLDKSEEDEHCKHSHDRSYQQVVVVKTNSRMGGERPLRRMMLVVVQMSNPDIEVS